VLDFGHPLATGIVGAWLFNEGSGLQLNSAHPQSLPGALTNAPQWRGVPNGDSGIDFVSASDQYVDLGNPVALQIVNDITIVTSYCLTTAAADGQLVAKDSNTGGRAYTLDFRVGVVPNGNRFYINGGGGADIVSDSVIPVAGESHVIAGSYRKGTKRLALYVDGNLKASGTAATSGIPTATANAMFARRQFSGSTNPLNGGLRYVYIWNVERSPNDIAWLYEEPYAMFRGPEVMRRYWVLGALPLLDAPSLTPYAPRAVERIEVVPY
jgi:hypothetical protein